MTLSPGTITRQLCRYCRIVIRTLVIMVAAGICVSAFAAERETAPPFTLPDVEGSEQSLSDHHGKVVLLSFWATWCPPCRVEMPQLEHLFQTLKGKGFVVLAIASDAFPSRTVVPAAKEMKLTFPVLLDSDARITSLYRVSVRPTSYLVDREGKLVWRAVGPHDWAEDNELLGSIRELLDAGLKNESQKVTHLTLHQPEA